MLIISQLRRLVKTRKQQRQKEVKNGMEKNLDRIAAALELIAARLALIAAQLDPEALEKRRTAMFEQLAHELAEDPEKRA